MVRLASISLPRIDLQIVAQRHPEWKELPAGVVSEEKPLGRVLEVNRAGRAQGVQPGMRYASALTICPQLRVGVVNEQEREELAARVISVLKGYSPDVEQAAHDSGLFWLNASGMHRLYKSLAKWAGSVELAMERQGLVASVAVGFSRFGTYAAAKVKRAITVFETEDQERAAALRAPVGVLPLDHEVLARLHQLGIMTIREFCRFSPGALRRRFGRDVEEMQRFASGADRMPVRSPDERAPLRREIRLLYPEGNREAIGHHLCGMARELASQAFSRQELVSELFFELCPEQWPGRDEPCMSERIQTTRPTVDTARLERLITLRLEAIALGTPVVRLSMHAESIATDREQSELFALEHSPEFQKAEQALADIAAELGQESVCMARLEDSHLPECTFSWRKIIRIRPRLVESQFAVAAKEGNHELRPSIAPVLVRRMLAEPVALGKLPQEYHTTRLGGPYELSGGWWDEPYEREYYYLTDRTGRLLWIYYDRPSQRWMVQGVVE